MKKFPKQVRKEAWLFRCTQTGDYYLDSIGDMKDQPLHPVKYVSNRGWIKRPAKRVKVRITITEIE